MRHNFKDFNDHYTWLEKKLGSMPASKHEDCIIDKGDYQLEYHKGKICRVTTEDDIEELDHLPLIERLPLIPDCIKLLELAEKLDKELGKNLVKCTNLLKDAREIRECSNE